MLKNKTIDVSFLFISFLYSIRGGLNDWGGRKFFWKLISKGVLFNKGVENSYKTVNKTFNIEDAEAASHRRCSILKKGVLKNFAKLTGKRVPKSFLIKVQAAPATLIKKRLWHKCFPVNFPKFLRTAFLQNPSGWQLLYFPCYLLKIKTYFGNTLSFKFSGKLSTHTLARIFNENLAENIKLLW